MDNPAYMAPIRAHASRGPMAARAVIALARDAWPAVPDGETLKKMQKGLCAELDRAHLDSLHHGKIQSPNPKMVTPGDLMASLTYHKIGRFMEGR